MTKLAKDSNIYIAGHTGMVGSACWRLLEEHGYKNLIGRTSKSDTLTSSRGQNKGL